MTDDMAPLRVSILSFWHTNFTKRTRVGSWRPPTPHEVGDSTGNLGFATANGYPSPPQTFFPPVKLTKRWGTMLHMVENGLHMIMMMCRCADRVITQLELNHCLKWILTAITDVQDQRQKTPSFVSCSKMNV